MKGTTDSNWGDICVLAVGDLYQLSPVGQCPIYMSQQTVHTLNDIAPNGWEKMQLHELTQSMRQKDMKFVNCLNKICTTVPLEGSEEDRMLQACELKLNPNNENYPHDAMCSELIIYHIAPINQVITNSPSSMIMYISSTHSPIIEGAHYVYKHMCTL